MTLSLVVFFMLFSLNFVGVKTHYAITVRGIYQPEVSAHMDRNETHVVSSSSVICRHFLENATSKWQRWYGIHQNYGESQSLVNDFSNKGFTYNTKVLSIKISLKFDWPSDMRLLQTAWGPTTLKVRRPCLKQGGSALSASLHSML